MSKTLDTKTKKRRLELDLEDSLKEAKNGYPTWNKFQKGLTRIDPEEELILEDELDLEIKILSPEQASKLVKKAGDNGNGTKRYQNLVKSIKRRKLSQAIDKTKVYFMNPEDKQIYRVL